MGERGQLRAGMFGELFLHGIRSESNRVSLVGGSSCGPASDLFWRIRSLSQAPALELCEYPSPFLLYLSIHPSIHLSICLCINLSIYVSIYHLSHYLPIYLSIYHHLAIHPCICRLAIRIKSSEYFFVPSTVILYPIDVCRPLSSSPAGHVFLSTSQSHSFWLLKYSIIYSRSTRFSFNLIVERERERESETVKRGVIRERDKERAYWGRLLLRGDIERLLRGGSFAGFRG